MAFRADASAEGLTRTSGLPSSTAFTIAGWFRKRGAGDGTWENIFGILSSGGASWEILYKRISGSDVVNIHGTSGDASLGVTLANDTWYYCAIGCNGTGSTGLTGWVITTAGTVYTASTYGVTLTAVEMSILKSTGYGEWVNGSVANVTVWSTKLTTAELQQQMWSSVPIVQQASLHLWTPLWDTSSLYDLSGNGRTWTSMGGTPTTEDHPPVSWNAPVTWIIGQAAAGGPITQTVNQVTETDLAQVVARLKNKLLGQNAETDTTQAVTRLKNKLLGSNSETDLPQVITLRKIKSIGQASETEIALPLGTQIIVTLNQVTEADEAFAVSSRKSKVEGQVFETDLSQTIRPAHMRTLGQATEADSLFVLTRRKVIVLGLVGETDMALPLGTQIVEAVNQATESDLAQALFPSKRVAVAQVVETDAALVIGKSKQKVLGLNAETDGALATAWTGASLITVDVALANELEYALPMDVRKVHVGLTYPRRKRYTLGEWDEPLDGLVRKRNGKWR